DLAAVNREDEVVVAGELDKLRSLAGTLTSNAIKTKFLPVTHAFHSSMMAPVLCELQRFAGTVPYAAAQTAFVSSMDSVAADRSQSIDAKYWCDQLRRPVRFDRTIKTFIDRGVDTIVEVGPGTTLIGIVSRALDDGLLSVPTLTMTKADEEPFVFLQSL